MTEAKPTFVTYVAIALIVSEGEQAQYEAERYFNALHGFVSVILYGPEKLKNKIAALAKKKEIPLSYAETAPEAVRTANICIIFGDCPFTYKDIRILESQGMAVSQQPNNPPKRKKARGV